jgi:hypothetical protein
MAVFPVVLDANVLFGLMTTDILLTTAGRRMYRAHWTADILDEAERNILTKRPDLAASAVARRFDAMRRAMPEAMLDTPPQELIDAMTNHAGDRHVLAAAVSARAEVIATENGKHFPPAACIPFGIETRTLDEFICDLVSLNASDVWSSIGEMAERRMRPPQSITAVCDVLETHIPRALGELRLLGFGE